MLRRIRRARSRGLGVSGFSFSNQPALSFSYRERHFWPREYQ